MSKLIVGLGNPGDQYTWTRHNLGFLVLSGLGTRQKVSWRKSAYDFALLSKTKIEDVECSLLMPTSFMNESGASVGLSVKEIIQKRGGTLKDVLVVCDDLSLPFGKLRIRPSGSAGGHNGLKDIIGHLGSNDFARLRLGIGLPRVGADTADYVLSNFTPAEKKILPDFINHALDCVTCWVTEGAEAAMNMYNKKQKESA